MGSASVQGELWGAAAADWAQLQVPMSWPLWNAPFRTAGGVRLENRFWYLLVVPD